METQPETVIHGPNLQTAGAGKGLPVPTIPTQPTPPAVKAKPGEAGVLPRTSKELFAELKVEQAKKAPNEARIQAIREQLMILQNGTPAPKQDIRYVGSIFKKQDELGREHRINMVARSNKDVAWLLEKAKANFEATAELAALKANLESVSAENVALQSKLDEATAELAARSRRDQPLPGRALSPKAPDAPETDSAPVDSPKVKNSKK